MKILSLNDSPYECDLTIEYNGTIAHGFGRDYDQALKYAIDEMKYKLKTQIDQKRKSALADYVKALSSVGESEEQLKEFSEGAVFLLQAPKPPVNF